MRSLKNKDLISLHDYSKEEIMHIIELAMVLKEKKKRGLTGESLKGKNVALIFEKPSTRTRCAFTVACNDEGAFPEYLGKNDIQLGAKESVADTARVLTRMFDAIEFRGFKQETVEDLAKYSDVPVYNGLTDMYHPTQIFADLMTMREYVGELEGRKMVYVGDGRNNVATSLMIGCSKLGVHMTVVAPKELFPENAHVRICKEYAKHTGSKIEVTDSLDGVKGADVIYTDVWCSMGEEDKAKERVALLQPYQVNASLLGRTKNDKICVLHCLPAVKENEITTEVFEAQAAPIFEQAENRMHTIKAIMVATIGQ